MLHALTCGCRQQPINAKNISKKLQNSRYKQRKHKLREGGDCDLNKISLEHKIPTVTDLMEIPLAIFITFSANYYIYEGTTKDFIAKWVHLLFLMDHAKASKVDNPNWNQGNE